MSFNLLYLAIIVFGLLVVGLVLTVLEFSKIKKISDAKDIEDRRKNN
jgi:hypothetical protein